MSSLDPTDANTLASNTAAFCAGIEERDRGCVICGITDKILMDRCHIIPQSETTTWESLRELGHIPINAKGVQHECRNGIYMCDLHRMAFDLHRFYIRWAPETNEFILINHSRYPDYERFHGCVARFDPDEKRCPFPTAFLWHESRVRDDHPTLGDRCVTVRSQPAPFDIGFRKYVPVGDHSVTVDFSGDHDMYVPLRDKTAFTEFTPVRLGADKLASWLQAAKQHSSWKECMIENTSWDGTAEENAEKYQRVVIL